MNAHLTNHLHWHWLDELTHKFSEIAHNTKLWQFIGIAAIVAVLLMLLVLAGTLGGDGQVTSYYGYPGYPVVP